MMLVIEWKYITKYLLPKSIHNLYPSSIVEVLNSCPFVCVARYFDSEEKAMIQLASAIKLFRNRLPEFEYKVTRKNFRVYRKLKRIRFEH